MDQVKKYLQLLLNDQPWQDEKVTYSDGSSVINQTTTVNNIKITIKKEVVSTQHIHSTHTYREHTDLGSIIKEIEEVRNPLFQFSMF